MLTTRYNPSAFSGSVLSSSKSLLSQGKCRWSSSLAMFQLIHKWRNKPGNPKLNRKLHENFNISWPILRELGRVQSSGLKFGIIRGSSSILFNNNKRLKNKIKKSHAGWSLNVNNFTLTEYYVFFLALELNRNTESRYSIFAFIQQHASILWRRWLWFTTYFLFYFITVTKCRKFGWLWTPVVTENMQKDLKSFRAVFSKWLPLHLATSNEHNFSTFWMTAFI